MEVGTIHAQVAEDRRRAPGSAVHVDGLGIGVDPQHVAVGLHELAGDPGAEPAEPEDGHGGAVAPAGGEQGTGEISQ